MTGFGRDDERYKRAVEAAERESEIGSTAWWIIDAFLGSLAGEDPPVTLTEQAADGKHTVQRDIEDFHRSVVGIPDSKTPMIRRPGLRAELIREETRETIEVIERGDLVAALDGLCDILAVTYGAAAEWGINLAPFWDEVHRTNMAKAGGPLRADGKRLKPEGWQPPDIAGILQRLTAESVA